MIINNGDGRSPRWRYQTPRSCLFKNHWRICLSPSLAQFQHRVGFKRQTSQSHIWRISRVHKRPGFILSRSSENISEWHFKQGTSAGVSRVVHSVALHQRSASSVRCVRSGPISERDSELLPGTKLSWTTSLYAHQLSSSLDVTGWAAGRHKQQTNKFS